ncbi:MAG: prepilin peptidase [Mycobacterium sp.]|jgi:leader peptidase (prepilin peptidase)/N-methyltransferase|nr:prepilin peptidase [Mycobacterium sp.]
MTAALAVLAGLLGLAVGSFLNVVVWRVPRGESVVTPRSHCPRCEHAIRPRDEIPVVSWLLLRGRCRDCKEPINARYPLVELLTAAVFVAVTVRFRDDLGFLPAYLYLGALGVALALIDFDIKKLPNVLTLPAYAVGPALLVLAVVGGEQGGWAALLRAVVGLAAMFAFYYVLWFGTGGRGMGFGDVKLAGVVGLFLAFLGWQVWLVGLFAGFFVGGVVGIALMAGGRAGRKTKLPYGPFMLVGALIAILVGSGIAHSYLHAVGQA